MEQKQCTPAEALALVISQINDINIPVLYAKQIAEPLAQVVANIEVIRSALLAPPKAKTEPEDAKGE
jgi:hypothetical protein